MGCLAVLATGSLGLLALIALPFVLATGEVPEGLLVALGLAGLVTAALRHQARVRRARRLERRAQRRSRRPALRAGSARPIDGSAPLPRAWWQPVHAARTAQRDYEHATASMQAGPLRERLEEAIPPLREGVRSCDALARRGAELDRQLRRLPPPVAAAAEGRQLRHAVAEARAQLEERSAALALAAARAAKVAVHQTVARDEELLDVVRDLETTVGGLAAAVDDVATRPGRHWAATTVDDLATGPVRHPGDATTVDLAAPGRFRNGDGPGERRMQP